MRLAYCHDNEKTGMQSVHELVSLSFVVLFGCLHWIWTRLRSQLTGEIEVDESYFGAKRSRGKRGRGAFGKTAVFGVFKRNGYVYTEIVPDCSKSTLQAIN